MKCLMMTKTTKNIYRAIKAHKIRFLTIALVIAIGIMSFNGMITAFIHMTRTYDEAFDKHNMASFTIQTANPGGSGEDAWIDYNNLTQYLTEFQNQEPRSMIAFELRIIHSTVFEIRGERQNGQIVAMSTVDSEGNFRKQPDVNGYNILSGSPFSETSRYQDVCLVEAHLAEYWKLEQHEFIAVGDNQEPFEVQGSIASPEYLINMGSYSDIMPSPRRFGVIFLPLKTAQTLLNVQGKVNEISVLLEDGLSQNVRKNIADDLKTYLEEIHGLKLSDPIDIDNQPAYWLMRLDIEEAREFGLFLPILILGMAIGGLYVLLGRMVVAERKDIGVAQALGYSRNAIIQQYVGIALVIAIIGTTLGTLLGLMFLSVFSPLYVDMLTIPFTPKVTLEWHIILIGIVIGLLTGLVGGYFPVRNSIQPLPAESLRFDPSLHITSGRIPTIERIFAKIRIRPRVSGLRLPLRNFFRSKRRTLSSVFAIIVSVSLISMAFGMLESMDSSLTFYYDVSEDWDLRVDFSEIPTNASQIATAIQNDIEGITNTTYHLLSGATVTSSHSSKEKQVQLLGMKDSNGYLAHAFDFKDGGWDSEGIILSVPIADSLNVWVNDEVALALPKLTELVSTSPLRAHFELVNVTFEVTGIIDEFNGLVAFVGLDNLVTESNFPGNPANSILMKVENPTPERLGIIRDEIYSKYDYNVKNIATQEEQKGELLNLMDLLYFIIYIVAIFAVLLSCAIIYNTIFISLQEQQRELATLKTIGTDNRTLIRNITLENTVITFVGTILGVILGWILLWLMMSVILNMEFFRIQLFISFNTMITSFVMTYIGVLIAQYFPLRRVLNLNLAEATKERVV